MKEFQLTTQVKVYSYDELSADDRLLAEAARKATLRSYAPYSHFHVGAAVSLENGVIMTGTNQENVAYPSGLCAERTVLFYANSQHPDVAVKALAIAACQADGTPPEMPVSPCGACRQVMTETERRYGKPIRILLCGKEEVYVVDSAANLMPLSFNLPPESR